jgi:hypothetical protein
LRMMSLSLDFGTFGRPSFGFIKHFA